MDSERFKQLVMPHHRLMYGVAISLTGNRDAVYDAVQDAMVRLWEMRGELDGVTNIRGFVMTVTRNICIDAIRRSRHTYDIADPAVAVQVDRVGDIDPMVGADSLGYVERLIAGLPDAQRRVLTLRAYGDLDNDEIAAELGISNDTVRQQLSRARRKLRELLKR